jgi:hypothetical protein
MIYDAIVLDNTTYLTTGTIKVRVFAFYLGPRFSYDANGKKTPLPGIADLSKDPSLIDEGKWKDTEGNVGSGLEQPHQDFDAWIFTAMGGGQNYGMFHLPQVNEKGIVSFLDGDIYKPIWMGSYFEPLLDLTKYPKQEIQEINIPSDNALDDSGSGFVKDNKASATADPNAIVIRTKHTSLKPQGSDYDPSKLDWKQQPTENLIVISNDAIRFRKFEEKGKDGKISAYEDISLTKNSDSRPIITFQVNNIADKKSNTVTINDTDFIIQINNNGKIFSWSVSTSGDTGIYLVDQFHNKIIGNAQGLQLDTTANSGSKIVVIADKETDIMGTGDNLVRYSYLKNIIEKVENHVHITQGPAGPTTAAMDGPSGAPGIGSVITQDKNSMKTKKIVTDSS